MDWREKLGRPTTLVLYKTPERWRHAIYGSGGNVLDGYLHLRVDAPVEEAQAELTKLTSDIAQKPLMVEWTTDKPERWTGEVVDALQRLRALTNGLFGRAPVGSETAVGHSFDLRMADTLDLIEHGEPGIAFENLAQNVYEFDVPLTPAEYQAFDDVGRALNLNPDAWIFLAELVQ